MESPTKKQRMQRALSSSAKGSHPPVLYSYWRSTCSWRVRIALAWKGIEYEYKPVHLLNGGGEHFQEEYTKLNPNQRLPTLVIDNHALSQSSAILEYLEETHPDKPLMPSEPFKRAEVRKICGIIGSDIQPLQNLAIMTKVTENLPDSEKPAAKFAWAREWIERGFAGLEKELLLSSGTYCIGDQVTMADLYLEPQVYNAVRFKVDMSKYPTISRIAETLSELPAFQQSHPSKQIDAQN